MPYPSRSSSVTHIHAVDRIDVGAAIAVVVHAVADLVRVGVDRGVAVVTVDV